MTLIEKGENLIKILEGDFSLTSSQINKIDIFHVNNILCVDVDIQLLYKKIRLRFIDVQEYSFYYNNTTFFYNVEICKFFKIKNLFYISFDPIDESDNISIEDQDFIKAKAVEGLMHNEQ